MRRKSFEDMTCSIAQCLEAVGEWWSILIIRDAFFGVSRFDQFQQRLKIARNMLTRRLDHLVEHGIIERVPYQEHPVRYDYRLTDKGRDLWLVLTAMREWGDRWAAPRGAPVQVVHGTCDHVGTVVSTCSHCGQPMDSRNMQPIAGPGAGEPESLPPFLTQAAGS
jgi:DNA-binding HxlR family transcriptional regulator